MTQKDDEIADLKTVVLTKSRMMLNIKKMSTEKDQKLMEMNGVLEIYKAKLSDVSDELQKLKNSSAHGLSMSHFGFRDANF